MKIETIYQQPEAGLITAIEIQENQDKLSPMKIVEFYSKYVSTVERLIYIGNLLIISLLALSAIRLIRRYCMRFDFYWK